MIFDHGIFATPPDLELWRKIFGNDHPVEVEIGPGTGTFVLSAAKSNPAKNFFTIEKSFSRAGALQRMTAERRLANVRVLRADAAFVFAVSIPAGSLQAIHVYFPDPWWKQRHHRRRIFTPEFVATLARALIPGGYVYIATDVEMIFALMRQELRRSAEFIEEPDKPSPRTTITKFENKGLLRGSKIHQSAFRRG